MNEFVTCDGIGMVMTNAYIAGSALDVGVDIFENGIPKDH